MTGWRKVTLGSVLPFKYGKGLPARARSNTGEFKVMSSAGVTGTHSCCLTTGPSVVIGRKGTIGAVYYCPEPTWPIDTAFYVEGSSEVDLRFAYYLLADLPLRQMNNDSAVPGLNRSHAEGLEILLPEIDEQRLIAATLGALDDKVQSNLRAIASIEKLGLAMLERAMKRDSDGNPVADVRTLGEFLEVLETGLRPKGGIQAGQRGVVSLGAQHVQSAGVCMQSDFGRVSTDFAASMRRGCLAEGDVLVYKDGGKPGNFIPHISAFGYGFPVRDAVINEHVYRARAKHGVSQALLYWTLRTPWLDAEMRRRGTGVAIPGLNSTNFKELPFPLFSNEEREHLNTVLDPMLRRVLMFGAENSELAVVRDSLRPELVSGRLRVPDTAHAIEETWS